MQQQFETERLLIRLTNIDDAEFVFALVNSPTYLRYILNRNIATIADAKTYIKQKFLPQIERLGFGNYTVIRKADAVKLGSCGLYQRETNGPVDIGYAFLPSYEGNGYAYESSNKIKQAAFELFGLTELKAYTTEDNLRSRKLLTKLGFQEDGTTVWPNTDEVLLQYLCKKTK